MSHRGLSWHVNGWKTVNNCHGQIKKENNMKKLLVFALVALLMVSAFAGGQTEASTEPKDSATFVVAGNPFRFFHLTSYGCGGDDNIVLANIYDNLMCLENDGSLSYALAESYTLDETGTIYTFNLRKGVKFSNGMEMTAEDVKFTLDKGAAGPLGGPLLINYKECRIIDPYTVEVELTSPYAAFPYCVASRVGGIVCKAYWEEVGDEGYQNAPVGTGPYTLAAYAANDYITLEANPTHWRGCPSIKTIQIELVADTNTMILGLQNGDYDVMANPSIEMISRFEKDPSISTDITNSTGRITLYLQAVSGITADVNFRKAVQYAIDKEEVNIAVNNGAATIIDVDLCPMYTGHPTSGLHVVEKDIEKAKEYLKAANYNNEEFGILCQAGTNYETAAKVIQAQLMAIGINCVVEAVDNTTLRTRDGSRDFDGYLCDNLSSIPDADAIAGFFKPSRFPASVQYPRATEVYELSLKGCASPEGEREKYYTEICNITTDEAYMVPLYNGITSIAYNSNLEGVGAHCLNYYLFRYWNWK